MILIHSRVRKYPINKTALTLDMATLLHELGYDDFDISIMFTTNAGIRRYNREFRSKDTPTDVLSFPYHPDLKPGERIQVRHAEDKNLGDIIMSLEYINKKAQEQGNTLENQVKRLLVHGLCHLLGYDHIKDTDYRVMLQEEKRLLRKIQFQGTLR